MWNQCQHQGWYFVNWHRGYVFAFEAIIAKTIKDLGGPADWTLPYWNYLDASMEILLE
jgi:tyrosinase